MAPHPESAGGGVSEVLPFQQQDGESHQAFHAFSCYRDMQSDRSIEHVAQKIGKSSRVLARWSKKYNWVSRARSYDIALDARVRHVTEQDAVKERREMLKGHAEEARSLRKIARQLVTEFQRRWDEKGTLQWITGEDFIKMVGQLPKIVETAQKLERLAMGETAENLEPPKPFKDMTRDELNDYVARLRTVLSET